VRGVAEREEGCERVLREVRNRRFRCRESSDRVGGSVAGAPSLIVSAIETAWPQESTMPARAGYRGCKSNRWRPLATTLRVARTIPP
jgi:hypothetical protein